MNQATKQTPPLIMPATAEALNDLPMNIWFVLDLSRAQMVALKNAKKTALFARIGEINDDHCPESQALLQELESLINGEG